MTVDRCRSVHALPADREDLVRLIRCLTDEADQNPNAAYRPHTRLRALMMPHAGYTYSVVSAALAIARDRFGRVVLLGPDHRVEFHNAVVVEASYGRIYLGTVPVGDFSLMLRGWPLSGESAAGTGPEITLAGSTAALQQQR